jgi:hypothetical protein
MKTTNPFCIAVCSLVWSTCEFSAGKKEGFQTGLSVSNVGFSIGDSYLVGADNIKKTDNKVPINTTDGILCKALEIII